MSINILAYEEHETNKKYIREYFRSGFKVLEVDTQRVTFHGKQWRFLTDYWKRKFENLLFMKKTNAPIKVLYY